MTYMCLSHGLMFSFDSNNLRQVALIAGPSISVELILEMQFRLDVKEPLNLLESSGFAVSLYDLYVSPPLTRTT